MKQIIYDIEIYHNLFVVGILDLELGRLTTLTDEHIPRLSRFLRKYDPVLIGFNNLSYDGRILKYAIEHCDSPTLVAELKAFSDFIILGGTQEDKQRYARYWWDGQQIDLKMLLGGMRCPSLKKLSYRLHMEQIESLPISPDKVLTEEEKAIIKSYNENDLRNTKRLYDYCKERLELRETLTDMFSVDCSSLSDAQIAERVLGNNRGWRFSRPSFDWDFVAPIDPIAVSGDSYHFEHFGKFKTKLLSCGLHFDKVFNAATKRRVDKPFFVLDGELLEEFEIESTPPLSFRFGGMHSIHKSKHLVTGSNAFDVDVASYYPNLILKHKAYPDGLGEEFISRYQAILDKRIAAKKEGRKTEANALKIVLNSTFGHFKNLYSSMYDPLCGVSICLNGQLSLLRLIDMCITNGIDVLMANTDGIMTAQSPYKVVREWEKEMGMDLEVKEIARYCLKDSNNHILKYKDGSMKVKGIQFAYESSIEKQSNYPIINKAVVLYLMDGKPVEDTIRECDDPYQFMSCYSKGPSIDTVKLAKTVEDEGREVPSIVRYYLGEHSQEQLWRRNAKGWTRIADTEGVVMANKVEGMPADLNYKLYAEKAKTKLRKMV